MSRKLRTTIPIIPAELKPKVPDLASLAEREERNNETIKESFDTRHQARLLSQLPAGTRVWIPDQKQLGSVISPASPRSYIVKTLQGKYDATEEASTLFLTRTLKTDSRVQERIHHRTVTPRKETTTVKSIYRKEETLRRKATTVREFRVTAAFLRLLIFSGRITHPPDRLDL